VLDEDVRMSCMLRLAVLRGRLGDELPYKDCLDEGFQFRGARVPFFNLQKGIFRAKVQRGPAALSIQTSAKSPYGDALTDLGLRYAYRAGAVDQPDNRALRAAFELQVPLVYFGATRAGWYQADYPYYVTADDRANRHVIVTPGEMKGALDDQEPVLIADEIERRYAVRAMKTRLYQGRFRGLVLPAYSERCAICRLHEPRLLDAAHIESDASPTGAAAIANGVSLCTIHHRAFDQDLVGISPDYEVRVARRLLEEEDGPMLDLLKQFHRSDLHVPARTAQRPDRERLAARFERFAAA
jgi:putative restriction endonuclease